MKYLIYVFIGFAFIGLGCHDKGDSQVVYEDTEIVVTKIYYDNQDHFFLKTNYKGNGPSPNLTWNFPQGRYQGTTGGVVVINADSLLGQGEIMLNDDRFLVISKK